LKDGDAPTPEEDSGENKVKSLNLLRKSLKEVDDPVPERDSSLISLP